MTELEIAFMQGAGTGIRLARCRGGGCLFKEVLNGCIHERETLLYERKLGKNSELEQEEEEV